MPETEEHPMVIGELLEIGYRNRECRCHGGVMIQDDEGRYYWASQTALESTSYELPLSVRQKIENRENIEQLLSDHVDGIFKFASKNRAPEFVRAISSKNEPLLSMSESLMKQDRISRTIDSVPIGIARAGQTAMFAFLAAHGFANTEIARVFDVSESTVRVNLSKFKNN
jgi:uncharacterized protein YecE (DUF72 family)